MFVKSQPLQICDPNGILSFAFFFSPPSKPARLRDVFFQTLHVVHWSLRKTDFLSVMYAGDVSETQCLVADVPLCSYCNDEVLMWESADFFW